MNKGSLTRIKLKYCQVCGESLSVLTKKWKYCPKHENKKVSKKSYIKH